MHGSRDASEPQYAARDASSPLGGREASKQIFILRPQSGRDYPPNLSILLSGGKETNQDSPSSGERTGKSPAPNPAAVHGRREMWCLGGSAHPAVARRVQVLLERGHLPREGARPVAAAADSGRISPQSRVA